jgi:hypothetical protein
MGNDIIRKYQLDETESSRGGLNSLWKIYPGTNGLSKEQISVWILTKDHLPDYESKIMEQLFRIMKKDLQIMKELSSNNSYIKIHEVIEDGRMDVAFVTERIICSLSDILTKFRNFPNNEELYSNYLDSYGLLTEPEITRGFYNITSTLQHFHSVSRRFHLNISPENILLLPNGQWKLCGFGLSLSLQNGELVVPIPYFLPTMATSTLAAAISLEPNDSYLCPEIASTPSQSSSIQYATPESDVFSLGLVLYEIYHHLLFNQKRGLTFRPLLESHHSSHNAQHRDIVSAHPKHIVLESLRQHADTLPISADLRSLLLLMLDPNPSTRTNLSTLLSHPIFLSSPLSLYFQMDYLPQLLNSVSYALQSKVSKSDIPTISLLTSFPSTLSQLRPFILHEQVLPLIVSSTQQHPFLWEFSLPILISLSSQVPISTFLEHTSSLFISAFSSSSNGELILLLLQHMNFFLDLFSRSYFNQYIVLLFYSAINFHSLPSLQSIAISILSDEKILEAIEVVYYRKTLIPLVCHVICQQSDQTVKLHGVIFFKFILPSLDQEYIQTFLLPTFRHLLTYPSLSPSSAATSASSVSASSGSPDTHSSNPTGGSSNSSSSSSSCSSVDPVLLMTLLPVYKQISQLVSVDLVCKEIISVLLPLLIDRSLSRDHYRYVTEQIQSYLSLLSRAREADYSDTVTGTASSLADERQTEDRAVNQQKKTLSLPLPSLPSQEEEQPFRQRQPYRDQDQTVASYPHPLSFSSGTSTGGSETVDSSSLSSSSSSLSHLSSLREEIQRTQAEILRLQTHLSSTSASASTLAAPLSSPPSVPSLSPSLATPFPPMMMAQQGYDLSASASYQPLGPPYWVPPQSHANGYGSGVGQIQSQSQQSPAPFPFPHYQQLQPQPSSIQLPLPPEGAGAYPHPYPSGYLSDPMGLPSSFSAYGSSYPAPHSSQSMNPFDSPGKGQG